MTDRGPAICWATAAVAVVAVPAVVVGGPVAGVVVALLGVQAVVAAWRWPEVGGAARTLLTRTVPLALGWLVIVVALDAAAGTLWNRATGTDVTLPSDDEVLADADLPPTTDPRVATPAFADSPWAERYLEEMDALDYGYVPFIGPRVLTVHGQYINSEDGVRRSYEPPDLGEDAVEVWFFGGSTTWGEGQRDLHTIPSEVARLAEDDGLPLRVVNFGERGYTAFQEYLLFEQELADRGPPDVAVFYDGENELGTQQESPENLSVQPTVYQLATVLEGLDRIKALPGAGAPPEPSLGTEYVETSALHKLLRRLHLIESAEAQEVAAPLEQVLTNAAEIYDRSVTLQRDLAERAGTRVLNFWQPNKRDNAVYNDLATRIPDGVIDISDAYLGEPDDEALFIDPGHTNEQGAHLSAVAIWTHLRPVLERQGAP